MQNVTHETRINEIIIFWLSTFTMNDIILAADKYFSAVKLNLLDFFRFSFASSFK